MSSASETVPNANAEIESLAVRTEQLLNVTGEISPRQRGPSAVDPGELNTLSIPASSSESEYQYTHTIPPDVLEKLQAARADGDTGPCWTYELYRDVDDNPPVYHYCRTLADSEKYAKLFRGESHLGLDLEWKPSASKVCPAKDNVSTIQLASQTRVAVFHIALHAGDTADELVAPALRQILEDPTVIKTGVKVDGDATKLRRHLFVDVKSAYELSPLYRTVFFAATDRSEYNRRFVALSRQVENVLGLPLYKGEDVRNSDWTKPLNKQQVVYAASDAYAGWWLYTALHARWHAMHPRPPLPTPAVRRAPAATDDGDGDGEPARRAQPRPRRTKAPVKLPPSPALAEAESWLAVHAPSYPGSSTRSLRAYALWHAQGMTPRAAAAVLRRPSLSQATVAGYVADALATSWRRGVGLPLDAERGPEIADLLSSTQRRVWEWACRTAARPVSERVVIDPDARYFSGSESESDARSGGACGSEFEPDDEEEEDEEDEDADELEDGDEDEGEAGDADGGARDDGNGSHDDNDNGNAKDKST